MARTVDPLYAAAARLSHATRNDQPAEVIFEMRRELVGAQIQRFVSRLLDEGCPPTEEQTRMICDMLTEASKAPVAV